MAVLVEAATVAKCRPQHVWEKFRELHAWPWWNQLIGEAKWLAGNPWEEGSQLELEIVRPRRIHMEAAVVEVSAPNLVHWSGRIMGVHGEQWFWFQSDGDGMTHLKSRQELTGAMTIFLTESGRKGVETVLQNWLEALKLEAEKLAREEAARS